MRVWMIIVMFVAWTVQASAVEEQKQVLKPTLEVRLPLAARTYPQVMFKRSDLQPGPILYPEYMDFNGIAEVYGPPEFLKAMDAKLRDVERDPATMKDFIYVKLVKYDGDKSVDIPEAAAKIKIRMGSDDRRGPEGFEWLFSIPADAIKWEPGAYHFELGMWYEDNGAHKTVGAVAYFEVRNVKKGSDDEINLLSNAISNEVPGLSDRLLADPTYTKKDLAQKILELDPNDVFARYALALKALQLDGDPDTAVRMWEEIQKLVADGKAHRPESLILSPHSFIREPLTKEEYERMLSQSISLRSQQAKVAQEQSAKAKEEIAALVHDRKFQEIIALTATTGPKGILSSDNMWQVLWAIRAVKNAKTKEAHETLVQELAKLPHIPAMFQREIVDALATIHDDPVHGNLASHTGDEGIAIIEWWLARPKLEDMQSKNSEKDATPPRDGEPVPPAEGGTSPPTEGTSPPPGSGNP